MSDCNQIKFKVLDLLMNETFSYSKQVVYERYIVLAKKNSKLRNTTDKFFTHQGKIYPTRFPNGASIQGIRVPAAPLHYSLLDEFNNINSKDLSDHKTKIRNFFIAVLSNSAYGITLEQFIPKILINKIKSEVGVIGYKLLNDGDKNRLPKEEIMQTNEEIKTHYKESITLLKNILMEQILLQ